MIAAGPVEQVEVVVIDQAGCIKDALWGGEHTTLELRCRGGSRLERAVVLRAQIDGTRRLGGSWLECEDALLDADTTSLRHRLLICDGFGASLVLDIVVFIVFVAIAQGKAVQ